MNTAISPEDEEKIDKLMKAVETQLPKQSNVSPGELDKRFTYHSPKGDQPARYEEIRSAARTFAEILRKNCPESRELSLAITNLEESTMWANASIARNE